MRALRGSPKIYSVEKKVLGQFPVMRLLRGWPTRAEDLLHLGRKSETDFRSLPDFRTPFISVRKVGGGDL